MTQMPFIDVGEFQFVHSLFVFGNECTIHWSRRIFLLQFFVFLLLLSLRSPSLHKGNTPLLSLLSCFLQQGFPLLQICFIFQKLFPCLLPFESALCACIHCVFVYVCVCVCLCVYVLCMYCVCIVCVCVLCVLGDTSI